jgi:hypothetical protein
MVEHKKTHKRYNKTKTKPKTRRYNKWGGASLMGKGSSKGSRHNRPPTPPSLTRSCTNSSMLFNSLYGDENEANRNNLKRKFKNDDTIKQALFQLYPPGEVPKDIVFFLNPIESGIYLNWAITGKQILHVTIHTGTYKEGATARMLNACDQKGNMHITFDLLPRKDEVKLSVDTKMIVDISPKRKLKDGLMGDDINPKDDIIAKVIEIIQIYIDETFGRR